MTNYTEEAKEGAITGRAWRTKELRIKSNDDLHKLWYVLLMEKNKLMSDRILATQLQQEYRAINNMKKVRLSMTRLLTVVNERKKLLKAY